jgi:hypothetical protein
MSTSSIEALLQDRRFLPLKLDLERARVLLVRLDEQSRDAAAFLDDRVLVQGVEAYWIPLERWLEFPRDPQARTDWIFHIGHCGSTLLTRLMQHWPDVSMLREPGALRDVAAWSVGKRVDAGRLLERLACDWARASQESRTVVKATSSCNVLVEAALGLHAANRAIWLDMAAEPWLATLLKSADSVRDAIAATPERARWVAGDDHRLVQELLALPPVRQCAFGWHVEEQRREKLLAGSHGPRVLHLDFDRLLDDPESTLRRVAAHLDLDPARVSDAMASPWWRRYSKSAAHAYDAHAREADLRLARERQGDAITDALRWLDTWRTRHAILA